MFHKKINKKVNKQNIRNSENWLFDDVSKILNIEILKHSRKIYDKEYEDTVNTQNEAFLSLHIRLNNQGLERHAEHYIFNWYTKLYIPSTLNIDLILLHTIDCVCRKC